MTAPRAGLHVLMIPSFYSDAEHPQGGVFIREQALGLRDFGIEVRLAVLEARRLRYLSPAALRTSRFQTTWTVEDGLEVLRQHGWNPFLNQPFGGRLTVLLLDALVTRYVTRYGRPDVIHAHNALYAGLAATRAGQRLGRPVVITEHNPFQYWGDLLRRAYGAAEFVMPVSDHLARRLAPYMLRPERLVTVPNSVDISLFALREGTRRSTGWRFLAAGNLVEVKQFARLIDAFAIAFAGDPGAELRIAGDGPQERILRQRIAAHGLANRVTLLGRLGRSALCDEMRAADAFVVSSRSESFSIVLIEALATGLPVVATRCGGPETIIDEEVGVLVDAEDTAALAAGLRRVRERSWDSRRLRAHVVQKYSRAIVIPQVIAVYERARQSMARHV